MKEKRKRGALYIITKTISWIVMGILCLIGAFLISYIAINKISIAKGGQPPLGLYTIISPSMTPEIQVYDVVFTVREDAQKVKIGDVITYYSTNAFFGSTPITHRVVEKFNTNNGVTFRTRGDANPVVDNEIVSENNVIGVVKFVIPQLGRVQFFLASKFGWITLILIPAVGVIIYDILKLTKLVKIKNKMQKIEEETQERVNEKEVKRKTKKIQ